jgi:hypothetical protein
MDEEREADLSESEGKGRRHGRFAKVEHDDGEIDTGSRQSLRTKHSSKNVSTRY